MREIDTYRKTRAFRIFAYGASLGFLILLIVFVLGLVQILDSSNLKRFMFVGFIFTFLSLAYLQAVLIYKNRSDKISGGTTFISLSRVGVQFSQNYYSTQIFLLFVLTISLALVGLMLSLF